MAEHNAVLRAARARLPSRRAPGEPMTRAELADAVNAWLWEHTSRRFDLDDHLIGKWERGIVRYPIAPYRAGLRAVLGVREDADLGFARPAGGPSGARVRTPDGWTAAAVVHDATTSVEFDLLNRRDALRMAALGGAGLLGPLAGWLEPLAAGPLSARSGAFAEPEVEAVESLVATFREWRSAGTGLGRTAVVGQLADVSERLRDAPAGPLTDRVFLAAAELARIAGSMAFDSGAHRVAQHHYVLAARMAKSGDNLSFGAVALAALARLQFDLAAPEDGLAVVQLAQRGTRGAATPRLRAMLALREGWAHALLGDVRRFRSSIETAEEAHADGDNASEPRWLQGLDVAELAGTIGARYRDLARHDRLQARHAVDYIGRALELRASARTRNRAFDLVSLGRAHLLVGEADEAAASLRAALPHVGRHRPGRLGRKVVEWDREAAPFATVPAVADVRERVRAMQLISGSN